MTELGRLRAELLSAPGALNELESDWARLWGGLPRREIFTGINWNMASWETFRGSRQLCLVAVRQGADLVGLLPLSAGREGVRFLGAHHADYNDMLAAGEAPSAVVVAALDALLESGVPGPIVLENLPEWSILCRTLGSLPERLRSRISVAPGQPCPALRLGQDREVVLAAMVGKQSLKRHEKKLSRLGRLALRHVEERDGIRERVPDFFAQHVARRALAGERSLFLDAASRRFYSQLIDRLDPTGELRFAILELDGRPVAYHLGFEVDGRFTWYKPTFDVDYWDCGAGEVLLKRLLEYVRDCSVVEFDFTRGAESFKDRFSNHVGQNVHWTLHRSSRAAWLAGVRRRARTRVAAAPGMANVLRAMRPLARSARVLARGRPPDAPDRVDSTPVTRFGWARDEWLVWSAETRALVSRPQPSVVNTVVRRGSLRELAMFSVAGSPVLPMAGLSAARERLSAGDTAYLGVRDGALCCLAWRCHRSEVVVEGEGRKALRVALPGPVDLIETVGSTTVEMSSAMLARIAGEATGEWLWLLCPAGDTAWTGAAVELGFQPRYRLGRTSLLGREVRTWVERCGDSP